MDNLTVKESLDVLYSSEEGGLYRALKDKCFAPGDAGVCTGIDFHFRNSDNPSTAGKVLYCEVGKRQLPETFLRMKKTAGGTFTVVQPKKGVGVSIADICYVTMDISAMAVTNLQIIVDRYNRVRESLSLLHSKEKGGLRAALEGKAYYGEPVPIYFCYGLNGYLQFAYALDEFPSELRILPVGTLDHKLICGDNPRVEIGNLDFGSVEETVGELNGKKIRVPQPVDVFPAVQQVIFKANELYNKARLS